jgi:hypothetical protein
VAIGILELVDMGRAWRFRRAATRAENGLRGPAFLSPLEQAAYHEAGHILVSAVFGIRTMAAFITEHGYGQVFHEVNLDPEAPIEEAVPLVLAWIAGPIAEAKLACCNVGESFLAATPDLARAVKAIGFMTPLDDAKAERLALLVFARATIILMYECRQTLEQLVRLLLERRIVGARDLELITERSQEIEAARAKINIRKWNRQLVTMVRNQFQQ